MNKEQVKETAKKIIASLEKDISDRRGLRQEWERIDEGVKAEIHEAWASIITKQIEPLFPQGEGGLLSDEEICKTACGEYAGKCPARKLNHGCSDFVDIMAVITKQHALDQQHEANALKEQRERVIEKIDKSYLYLRSVCLFTQDDGELARGYDLAMNEALLQLAALKAELERENG